MMKKRHTARKFVLSAIASSLLALPAFAANDLVIDQRPLLGVTDITPAMVLALSVEAPTAGMAYPYKNRYLNKSALQNENMGYFDPNTCYEYVIEKTHGTTGSGSYYDAFLTGSLAYYGDGYFRISGEAKTQDGYHGLCNNDGKTNEWSGNALNYLTMSAVDIFRQTLTGGNRAKGVGSTASVYEAGDTADKSYLRRAMVWRGTSGKSADRRDQQNGSFHRAMEFSNLGEEYIKKLVPHSVYNTSKQVPVFWSSGTGFYVVRYPRGTAIDKNHANPRTLGGGTGAAYEYSSNGKKARWFNVVVEQNELKEGLLQKYARNGLQAAAISYVAQYQTNLGNGDGIPNTNMLDVTYDGGVLRAKMGDITAELNSDKTIKQHSGNKQSGLLNYVNQFGDDQPYDDFDPVAELYYTAIRYLRNGAWQWDNGSQKSVGGTKKPYTNDGSINSNERFAVESWDTDPLNPSGDITKLKDAACYSPSIMLIGDTNTHQDDKLPNYPGTRFRGTDNVAMEKDGTTSYAKVAALQGLGAGWETANSGTSWGDGELHLGTPVTGIAGMAYWVRTNEVRPDVADAVRTAELAYTPMHISSFFIDVLEGNMLHSKPDKYGVGITATKDSDMYNTYYLGGKFGSFRYEEGKAYTENNFVRKLWTNDAEGDTSEPLFPLGMPRNYAIANNPENVKSALERAFQSIGFPQNTMQSGIQYNNASGAQLNLDTENGGSGSYVVKTVNSDGTVSYDYDRSKESSIIADARIGKTPLALRAGYRTSDWTGYLTANILFEAEQEFEYNGKPMKRFVTQEVELWDAGENLFTTCHKPNGCQQADERKIEAKGKSGSFIDFVAGKAGEFSDYIENPTIDDYVTKVTESGSSTATIARVNDDFFAKLNEGRDEAKRVTSQDLINYLRGDSTHEDAGKGLRARNDSLMGTSVYASVTPLSRNNAKDRVVPGVPKYDPGRKQCRYNPSFVREEDYVATSSNEGLLHIFDMAGKEVYAYMPQTAMPFLANYASPNYQHRYVNDGTSVLHEVCDPELSAAEYEAHKGDSSYIPQSAQTYLVGTTGRGGSSIYVINVTDENFHATLEINSQSKDVNGDLGILVAAPMVINDANGDSILVFSSGYNNSTDTGWLYFYDLKTGSQINKVRLGKGGVGSPFGYDSDDNGAVDRIYVGDNEGKVWRVSIGRNDKGEETDWSRASIGEEGTHLFTGEAPITSRPSAATVGGKTVILFGTGEYFSIEDLRRTDPVQQNYAYGLFDDGTSADITVDDLLNQEIYYTGADGKPILSFKDQNETEIQLMQVSQNELCTTVDDDKCKKVHKGWRLTLPEGYVVTSDSGFYGRENQVATYTATKVNNTDSTRCQVTGSTMLIAVDATTGGAYNRKVFNEPVLGETANPEAYGVAVATNLLGLNATAAHHKTTNGTGTTYRITDGTKTADVNMNEELLRNLRIQVRRISWREIF